MVVCTTITELREVITRSKQEHKVTGLVPTMGALHQGHLALVDKCKSSCDFTAVSIFVNPIQFNNEDDFNNYPSTTDHDLELLKNAGVDVVFLPSATEMYQKNSSLTMNFGFLESSMEGAHRAGHFSGVGVVVSKLFNLLQPDKAFFGQKDLQQLAIIKSLVKALNFPVEVIGVPTVRESSGLAMSSRNTRLSDTEKDKAASIYQALNDLRREIQAGTPFSTIKNDALIKLNNNGFDVEYLELVDADSLMSLQSKADSKVALCIAANLGSVRLIDNIVF